MSDSEEYDSDVEALNVNIFTFRINKKISILLNKSIKHKKCCKKS